MGLGVRLLGGCVIIFIFQCSEICEGEVLFEGKDEGFFMVIVLDRSNYMFYFGMWKIFFLVVVLVGIVFVDQCVFGISVFYKVQKIGGQNISMVFFDVVGDLSGKIYLVFKCYGKGSYIMSLYLCDVFVISEIDVFLMVKQGKMLVSGFGYVCKDKQMGKFLVWEIEYVDVFGGFYKFLVNVNGLVVVIVMCEGGNFVLVSYQFDFRGLIVGMKVVSVCW